MANPYGYYDQNGNLHAQNHHQPYQVPGYPPFQPQNGAPIAAVPPAHAQGEQAAGSHPMVVIPPRAPEYAQQYLQQQYPQQMNYPMQYVHQPPPPFQQPSSQMQNMHARRQPPVQAPPKPQRPPDSSKDSQVDVQMLALSLADEYIAAARKMGPVSSIAAKEEDLQTYHKLVATALGCIESVLSSNRKLHPRLEAVLRLRYASLLYEETENYGEAETELGKGIIVCQRSRMLDLKYCMQHLLARVLFKRSPQAGLKTLDRVIPEAEANEHTVWVYALRFLRVSLSMQSQPHPDTPGAIQNLSSICITAEQMGDVSINFTAATLEALLYLRNPGSESAKQAHLCIGSARKYQLQTNVEELGPVITLLNCVDLASSLMQHSSEQASAKLKEVVRLEDQTMHSGKSAADKGVLRVPCDRSRGGSLTSFTDGIFEKLPDGRDAISFTWAHPNDLFITGFFLAAVTKSLNSSMDRTAEDCLRQGMKLIDAALVLSEEKPEESPDSLHRVQWLSTIRWLMRFHFNLILCTRSDWVAAAKLHADLRRTIDKANLASNSLVTRLLTYLGGVVAQGSGDLSGALFAYQSPELSLLASRGSGPRPTDAETDVRILAALNTLLIVGSSAAQHETAAPLLARLATLCPNHPSKAVQAAHHLVVAAQYPDSAASRRAFDATATSDPTGGSSGPARRVSIVDTKAHLREVLLAYRGRSSQVLAMSLNLMAGLFLRSIVSEQADKGMSAALHHAQDLERAGGRGGLWTCVANAMLEGTHEQAGRGEEARGARERALGGWEKVPEGVKRSLVEMREREEAGM